MKCIVDLAFVGPQTNVKPEVGVGSRRGADRLEAALGAAAYWRPRPAKAGYGFIPASVNVTPLWLLLRHYHAQIKSLLNLFIRFVVVVTDWGGGGLCVTTYCLLRQAVSGSRCLGGLSFMIDEEGALCASLEREGQRSRDLCVCGIQCRRSAMWT
jgi:hypothetical protein